jgi:hypothetical protein
MSFFPSLRRSADKSGTRIAILYDQCAKRGWLLDLIYDALTRYEVT